MKNKNIYFVGFYRGKKDKHSFVNLFDCKKKYFLENGSTHEDRAKGIYYFPSMLYNYTLKGKLNYSNIVIDAKIKDLYRRDLRNYLGSGKIKTKIIQKDKLLIFRYILHKYLTNHKGISKFNPLNIIHFFKKLKYQSGQLNFNLLDDVRKFRLKENFLNGYSYSLNLLNSLNLDKNDIFILWGKPQSSYQLIINYLKERDIKYFFVEYGELPGTAMLSKKGIFGELFTSQSWKEFSNKTIDSEDIAYSKNILNTIKKDQISTKNYANNMYFLMKYFWDNSLHAKNKPKIIYVNGSELYASGFYHNRWGVDREGKNPNQMLLDKVVDYFGDDYMIMYKEHPMAIKYNQCSLLDPTHFPSVNFIDGLSMHDILEISDLIISLPSKVVVTALQYGKPIFVLGDFTIPESNKNMNYFTSTDFEQISQIKDIEDIEMSQEFIKFMAKLIKYNLIVFDKNLYYNMNIDEEKLKIKNTVLS